MATLPGVFTVDNKSYQHLQGVMLVNLNKIALEQKLSHSEYRIMGILIGYWNKKHLKAFPSLRMISKTARMSNSTVIKAINNLKCLELIIVSKDGKAGRNNYHINFEKFFNLTSNNNDTPKVIKIDTSCSNPKHIKNKTYIEKTNKIENDLIYYSKKEVFAQLKQWKVSNIKEFINKYSLEVIVKAIKITLNKAPDNPGAYFRIIVLNDSNNNNIICHNTTNQHLNDLLKSKYIEHKPTKKIFKIKPDQGNHYLFKYYKEDNSIIVDSGFRDNIQTFIPANEALYKQKNNIVYLKPSKEEIIKLLQEAGDFNQVEQLKNIWRLT